MPNNLIENGSLGTGSYEGGSGNSEAQRATIYDLLSEGEIHGLVGGPAGIYLDGTPIIDESDENIYGRLQGRKATGSGTSVTLGDLEQGVNLSDLYLGVRRDLVLAEGITGSGGTITGSKYVNGSANFPADVVGRRIHFKFGTFGFQGRLYRAKITKRVNSTTLRFDEIDDFPYSTSSITNFEISSEKYQISTGSSDTLTLATALPSPITNRNWAITSAQSAGYRNEDIAQNYESAGWFFRSGTRVQLLPAETRGVAGTSFGQDFNEEIKQTSRPVPRITPAIDGQDAIVKTASADFELGAPSITDAVKITLAFPQMLEFTDMGKKRPNAVEFQIFFEYLRGGTWYNSDGKLPTTTDETAEPIFGASDYTIRTRPATRRGDDVPETEANLQATYWALPEMENNTSSNTGVITRKSETEFTIDWVFDVNEFKPFTDWRVRIARVTGDELSDDEDHEGRHQSQLSSMFAITYDKLPFPYAAYAGIAVDSDDFTSIPSRAYLAKGLKIQVPTNYFTRDENGGIAAYTRNVTTGAEESSDQFWDGKFRGDISDDSWKTDISHINYPKVYCNNPAWVYYDILTNDRYGLGQFLEAQNINKYELYRIARYCDELIPDGKGGLEPRFTCNLYITEVQDAQKILSDMASIFRGILIWTEGTLTPVQDAVKDPVYTFTRGNVIDGRFSYETGSERTRSNQINVTWTDPEKFYKRSIEIVDDPKDIAERGKIITKDIVAFGCTSQGQAHRLGKWYLLTESLENTLVKFKTGINAAFLRPGDLVNIQDQSQTNVGGSGRVSNTQPASTTSVYLDRDFVPDGGGEYELSLIYPAYSAYLQQATARINGVVYSRGDLITQAYVDGNLTNLDTSSDVANATDDDGNLIGLSWSNFSRIETKPVSSWGNFGGKAIAIVSSAFSDTPTSETIWALSKTNDSNIRTKTRQFRVVSIAEDENYEFNVVGHEYIKGKFDAVDRGYEVTPITNSPIPTFDREPLARPTNLVVSIVPASDEDVSDKGEKELIASSFYDVSISWRRPLRGTTALELDRYFSHTEVRHNFTADRGFITLNAGKGYNITLRDPGSIFGIHSVFIRFVDTLGRKSKWVRTEINFNKNSKPSAPQPPQLNAVGSIVLGGTLDALVHITSDGTELTFNPPNFVLKAPQGPAYQITGAPILDYSSLPSGQSAYIWFDAGNRGVGDEASGSPGNFLAVNRITDTDARTPSGRPRNYTYYKELLSTSPDLTQIATVDLDISTTEFVDGIAIPVFPKTFNIDQYIDPAVITPGQVIRIGEGSPAWWGSIESVDSSSPGAPSFSITTREGVNKSFLASTSPGVFVTNFKPNWFDDFIIGQVYNNAGVFSLNIFSGNQGAQLGSNLLDEAGNVLYNLDVANDQLAIGDIGAINANSGFKLSRRRQTGPTEGRGDLFPAYWFLSDTDQNSIRYYSPAVRDEVLINDGRLVANALKITQNTTYDVSVFAKFEGGVGNSDVVIVANEFYSPGLPQGKRAIGGSPGIVGSPEDFVQPAQNVVPVATFSLGQGVYQTLTATYSPTAAIEAGEGFFSIGIGAENIDANENLWLDWAIISNNASNVSDWNSITNKPPDTDFLNIYQQWSDLNNNPMRPYAAANVNDWNAAYTTAFPNRSTDFAQLHIRLDKDNNHLYIVKENRGATPTTSVAFQLEVIGATINAGSLVGTSLEETITGIHPTNINWDTVNSNVYGPNGVNIDPSTPLATTGTGIDQARFTLSNLTQNTEFRLKVTNAVLPSSSDFFGLAFGDTAGIAADLESSTPIEFFFAPIDSNNYDALLLTNGPADPGATLGADWNTNLTNIPDNIIETWFQSTSPGGPGVSPNVGDIWIDSDNFYTYRYSPDSWQLVQDSDIGLALVQAAGAQALADSKIYVYWQSTSPTAADHPAGSPSIGDLWINPSQNNRMYRLDNLSPGNPAGTWVDARDTGIQDAVDAVAAFRPYAAANVNNWNAPYDSPFQDIQTGFVLFHVRVDRSNDYVYLTANTRGLTGSAEIAFEFEVIGTSVTNVIDTTGSSLETGELPSFQSSPINWTNVDQTIWAANGVLVDGTGGSATNGWYFTGTNIDSARLTLTEITPDTQFRLKVRNAVLSDSVNNDFGLAFGDTVGIRAGLELTPYEFLFSARDGSGYDALLLNNAPAEAGATLGATWGTNVFLIPPTLIETFYQSDPPTANKTGDLWIDSDTLETYRWTGSSWESVQDSEIGLALATAAGAQGLADSKIFVYRQSTSPTAADHPGGSPSVGDLWIDISNDNRLYRLDNISPGNPKGTWFESFQDYATWSKVVGADNVAQTFFQTTSPSSAVSEIGDIWIDSDNGFRAYRYNGTSWLDIQDEDIGGALARAIGADNLANTKTTTFFLNTSPGIINYGPAGSPSDGDLWIDANDGNKLYVLSNVSPGNPAGTWVDATIDYGSLQNVPENVIETYFEATSPTNHPYNTDDLWINTNTYETHRYVAGSWVSIQDQDIGIALSRATDTANTRIRTFFQAGEPTLAQYGQGSPIEGDLWIETDEGNRIHRYNGSIWQLAALDYTGIQNVPPNIVETYYQATSPTTGNAGDLWIDSDTFYTYRLSSSPGGDTWQQIQDEDVAAAIAIASGVQGLADSKVYIYYQATSPTTADHPAGSPSVGDLWIDTSDNNRIYRLDDLSPGNPAGTWYDVRDGGIQEAVDNAAQAIATAQDAAAIADGKIITWAQATSPTFAQYAPSSPSVGDLWIDTNDGNKLYRLDNISPGNIGGTWFVVQDDGISQALADAFDARALADGKASTFVQGTSPVLSDYTVGSPSDGDLWFDSTDGYRPYRLQDVTPGNVGGTWVSVAPDFSILTGTEKIIQTFYQSISPSFSESSVGDIWIDSNTFKTYRYSPFSWQQIQDQDIGQAILDAAGAQALADSKIFVFYQDTSPTAADHPAGSPSVGDLWIDTNDGNKLYRLDDISPGNIAGVWSLVRDTGIQEALDTADAALIAAQNAQGLVTWYQDTSPTFGQYAPGSPNEGDLWFDTNDGNRLYRLSISPGGYTWQDVQDTAIQTALTQAQNAEAIADGKIITWAQATSPTFAQYGQGSPTEGDIWIDTSDGNKLHRLSISPGGYTWQSLQDADIPAALSDAAAAAAIARGKATTFIQAGSPSDADYSGTTSPTTGDLWFDASDGYKMYRLSISPGGQTWQPAPPDFSILTGTDNVVETYFQSMSPEQANAGDLWIDSDNFQTYRFSPYAFNPTRGSWQFIQDSDIGLAIANAAGAQGLADSKVYVYAQNFSPTAANHPQNSPSTGDLWIHTGDNNKLYRLSISPNNPTGVWQEVTIDYSGILNVPPNIIETYYQATSPAAGSEGDLWIDSDTFQTYRLSVSPGGNTWQPIQDEEIGLALAVASNAQGLADSKIKVIAKATSPQLSDYGQGSPTEGDLWIDIDDGNKLYRYNASATQWVIASTSYEAIPNVPSTVVQTFYQSTSPAEGNEGDLWIDSDDNKTYRLNVSPGGDTWQLIQDSDIGDAIRQAAGAQALADSKVYIYYQPTSPTAADHPQNSPSIGDLWIDIDDGNKLYRLDDVSPGNTAGVWYEVTLEYAALQNVPPNIIETYFSAISPGNANQGDLWIDIDDYTTYKFSPYALDPIRGSWQAIQDSDIGLALATAVDASDTANSKVYIFYQGTSPVAAEHPQNSPSTGDLWIDTSDNNKLYRLSISPNNLPGIWQEVTNYEADWDIIFSTGGLLPDDNATVGAQAGVNLLDEAGTLLADIDLRNDELVGDQLGGINQNPSMSMSVNRGGISYVAGYMTDASSPGIAAGSPYPTWVDPDERDILRMQADGGGAVHTLSATAIRVPANGMIYELNAFVRKSTVGSMPITLRAQELKSNLPTGKTYIGGATHRAAMQLADNVVNVDNDPGVSNSDFTLLSGRYIPTAGTKWFSASLDGNGTETFDVEWFIVRELSAPNTGQVDYGGLIYNSNMLQQDFGRDAPAGWLGVADLRERQNNPGSPGALTTPIYQSERDWVKYSDNPKYNPNTIAAVAPGDPFYWADDVSSPHYQSRLYMSSTPFPVNTRTRYTFRAKVSSSDTNASPGSSGQRFYMRPIFLTTELEPGKLAIHPDANSTMWSGPGTYGWYAPSPQVQYWQAGTGTNIGIEDLTLTSPGDPQEYSAVWDPSQENPTPTWAVMGLYNWAQGIPAAYHPHDLLVHNATVEVTSTDNGVAMDENGNIIAPVNMTQTGKIWAGSDSYGSPVAKWMLDYANGTPRVDIGNATNYLRWDGSTLTIAGNVDIVGTSSTGAQEFSDSTRTYRVVAAGNNATNAPLGQGVSQLRDYEGNTIDAGSRSYNVSVMDRATRTWDSHTQYDVYGAEANATTMANALDALDDSKIVVIFTQDEPQTYRLRNGLDDAMYRCGASRQVFGSGSDTGNQTLQTGMFQFRGAYILIGIPGGGHGSGAEFYQGETASSADGWLDISFSVDSAGNVVGTSGTGTPGEQSWSNTATADTLGFNPNFSDWPEVSAYPKGWGVWGAAPVKERTIVKSGSFGARFNANGSTNMGIERYTASTAPATPIRLPNTVLLSGYVDYYIESYASGSGPQLYITVLHQNGVGNWTHFWTLPPTQVGAWHRFYFKRSMNDEFTNPASRPTADINNIRFLCMGSWDGGSGSWTGSVIFDSIHLNILEPQVGTLEAFEQGLTIRNGGLTFGTSSNNTGYIKTAGKDAWDDDTEGFFISQSATNTSFAFGNATNYFRWDGGLTFQFKGNVTATSGTFTGTVQASAGNIGGWDITSTQLQSATDKIILDDANERIVISDT